MFKDYLRVGICVQKVTVQQEGIEPALLWLRVTKVWFVINDDLELAWAVTTRC